MSPLIASAERWIASRKRWSGIRALEIQVRQKLAVSAIRALASSMSSGEASSSAQESEQKACSPFWSVWRACAISPSSPSGMLLRSLTVTPAPVASAV